jgi:hypothetical protein
MIRKVLLAACGAALMATPAWATQGEAPSDHGKKDAHDHPAQSHTCKPHKVGYTASGALIAHTLVLDAAAAGNGGSDQPAYSGDVTVDVTRANKHARADKGTSKTYTLAGTRIVLDLEDQNGDAVVDLGDVVAGVDVKVIGKVTKAKKRCDQTGFTPELTIKKLIVRAPQPATS